MFSTGRAAGVVSVELGGTRLPPALGRSLVFRVLPFDRRPWADWEQKVHRHLLVSGASVPVILAVLTTDTHCV